MTHVDTAPGMSTSAGPAAGASFLEWSPVFAGAVLAAALSFVLLTFGAAIGLSAASPWPTSGVPAKGLAALAVFWIMAQQIATFMAGGYIAGRMRTRWQGASQDEVEFRDGLHGGLVWAVGVLIGAALFLATAGAATRTGAEAAGKTAAAAAADPSAAIMDTMLRPVVVAQAGTSTSASSGASTSAPAGARPPAAASANPAAETRAEVARMLAAAVATGAMPEQSRAYLAQLVSQRTGLPQPEAEKRVNDAIASAREAADKARRAAILTGFVTAASLLISFCAAWWAAMRGGNHRDNAVPARFAIAFPRRP